MSQIEVKVVRISEILPHGNADRLEIAKVLGWNCIVQKGAFKKGDLCIYIPIDSVLPEKLAEDLGVAQYLKSRVRVRTVKLRGVISQGLVIEPNIGTYVKEGEDVTEILGITKYEPPVRGASMGGRERKSHPLFCKYTEIEHLQKYHDVLEPDEIVVVTEKEHGTNFRLAWLDMLDEDLKRTRWQRKWHKLLRFFNLRHNVKLANDQELYVGSHNVVLEYDKNNLYWRAAELLGRLIPGGLQTLPYNYIFFFEIVGYQGTEKMVQKGFPYGCEPGELDAHCIDIFDIKAGQYLDYDTYYYYHTLYGIPIVPIFEVMKWDLVDIDDWLSGFAHYDKNHVREGLVIKPVKERWDHRCGRVIFKAINPEYLLLKAQKEDKGEEEDELQH
jgi:RNA ligase (TIGR02306 family)